MLEGTLLGDPSVKTVMQDHKPRVPGHLDRQANWEKDQGRNCVA